MIKQCMKILWTLIIFTTIVFPQELSINKIEPPNWWTGMKWNNLQLMIYGKNLTDVSARFNDHRIKVVEVHEVENADYLFIDIEIPPGLEADTYQLTLWSEGSKIEFDYPIYERGNGVGKHQGFDAGDVIYLITPDRFVNGDLSNDYVDGMIDKPSPEDPIGRHGGDIRGIINKLDYLKDLGITAIWINPLVENNTNISYHGYAATDLYKVDARFGSNELYKELVDEAHKRELKIIYDHVSNHISTNHPWVKNLPMPDWINGTVEDHLQAIHHKMALSDIHGDSTSINYLIKGWFTDNMADLNQANLFVSNYIIQNTLWWIESTGLDGVREDTYPYADQKFLSEWAAAILDEYPNFNIVGEVWTGVPAFLASYQQGSYLPRSFDSNLPSVTDFGMRDTYYRFLKGENSLYHVYETLSQDYLYPDPQKLVVFIDNHDVTRAMLAANGDINKLKIALTLLLTTRGIPQILYATEVGMEGTEDHGTIRSDFPGGFPNHKRDAFTQNGRTEKENEIFTFLSRLLKLRKQYETLAYGKLIHFPPADDLYVYFKTLGDNTIMVLINSAKENRTLNLTGFDKYFKNSGRLHCLLSGKNYIYQKDLVLELESENVMILEIIQTN